MSTQTLAALLATNKQYIVAVDVAKKRDYTTIQIYRDSPEVTHFPVESGRNAIVYNYLDLVYQVKMQAMTYTTQVDKILELLNRIDMIDNAQLLVDGTGVGEPVVDIMRERGLLPFPIVFTGGSSPTPVYEEIGKVFGSNAAYGHFRGANVLKEMRVPKEDLVHAGMIAMQQGRLRIAKNIAHAEDFKNQLLRFKGTVNEKSGRKSYAAESEDIHDDFVVTFLMAAWWITYRRATERDATIPTSGDNGGWDPYDYIDSVTEEGN